MPMPPLKTVDLRHRMIIRRPTTTKKASGGGFEETWPEVATVYAEVIGQDGRESVMDQALQGISVYRIRIRWRGDLKTSDQASSEGDCFGGRTVNLRSIVDPDGKREQLIIMADTASTQVEV